MLNMIGQAKDKTDSQRDGTDQVSIFDFDEPLGNCVADSVVVCSKC